MMLGQYVPNDTVDSATLYYMAETHHGVVTNSSAADSVGTKSWQAYFNDLKSGRTYTSKIIAMSGDSTKPTILAP